MTLWKLLFRKQPLEETEDDELHRRVKRHVEKVKQAHSELEIVLDNLLERQERLRQND